MSEPRMSRPGRPVWSEVIDRVKELQEEGRPCIRTAITFEFQISRSTIYRILKSAGIDLDNQGVPR